MNAKAFPSSCSEPINKGKFGVIGVRETYEPGMTIRDYFAAKAMQGLMSRVDHVNGDCVTNASADDVAGYAYCIADAMMEAGKL